MKNKAFIKDHKNLATKKPVVSTVDFSEVCSEGEGRGERITVGRRWKEVFDPFIPTTKIEVEDRVHP